MKAKLAMRFDLKYMKRESFEDMIKFNNKKSTDMLFNDKSTSDRARAYVGQCGYCVLTGHIIPKEAIQDINSEQYRLVEFSSPSLPGKAKLLIDYDKKGPRQQKVNKDIISDMLTIGSIKKDIHDMLISEDTTWDFVPAAEVVTEKPADVKSDEKKTAVCDTGWICPKCFAQNKVLRVVCSECGASRDDKTILDLETGSSNNSFAGITRAIVKSSIASKKVRKESSENKETEEKMALIEKEKREATENTEKKKRIKRNRANIDTMTEVSHDADNAVSGDAPKRKFPVLELLAEANSRDYNNSSTEMSFDEFKHRNELKKSLCGRLYSIEENNGDLPAVVKNRVLRILREIDGLPSELFSGLTGERIQLYVGQLGYCLYTGEDIDINECINENGCKVECILPESIGGHNKEYNKVLVSESFAADKNKMYPADRKIVDKSGYLWLLLNSYGLLSGKKTELLFGNIAAAAG